VQLTSELLPHCELTHQFLELEMRMLALYKNHIVDGMLPFLLLLHPKPLNYSLIPLPTLVALLGVASMFQFRHLLMLTGDQALFPFVRLTRKSPHYSYENSYALIEFHQFDCLLLPHDALVPLTK